MRPKTDRYRLWSWLLTGFMIIPVWGIPFLPFVDLPLHQARTYILYSYNSHPFFQEVFDVILEPIPNVGTDLLLVGLQNIFSIDVSARILLTMLIVLFVTGIHTVFKLFATENKWLLVQAPLLTYHTFFVYGFLNYIAGLGLFLISFSYWYRHRTPHSSKEVRSQWIINAVLATVCYLTHLSSFVFLGIAVATVVILDLSKKSITTRYLVSSTGLLIPLVLFAAFMGGTGSNSGMTFSDVRGKLTSSLAMFTSYNTSFDLVFIGVLIATLLFSIAIAKRRVIHWEAATLAAVFFVCFLLSPAMLFTSHMADTRFMPVVTVFAFASLSLMHSAHLGRYLVAITLTFFVVRSGMIVYEWVNLSPKLEKHYELATMFPEGSRIKSLYYTETITFQKRERPFEHLLAYLMIEKNVTVSDFIAKRGQQPVVYRRPSIEFSITPSTQLDDRYLQQLEREHDHIWAYKLSEAHNGILRKHYRLLYSDAEVGLYSLR